MVWPSHRATTVSSSFRHRGKREPSHSPSPSSTGFSRGTNSATASSSQISAHPERPYYESWAAALEALVVENELADPDAIDAATPTDRQPL